MCTIRILGRDYEARPLSPVQRMRWNSHLLNLLKDGFWVDLYRRIQSLPEPVQLEIVRVARCPETLDRVRYFDLSTRVDSVVLLLSMTVEHRRALVVDPTNAAEIFWALQPMILAKAVVLEGAEGLAKIREATDAGLS